MKRRLFGIGLATAILALPLGAAAFEDGYELMKASSRGHEFRAYVSGVMEGHMITAALLRLPQLACPAPETTRQELAGVVLLYLAKNQHRLDMTARSLVFTALVRQYPCK